MDLVRAGILEQVPGRRASQLTATSLRAWMAAREPGDVAAGSISCPAAIMPLRVIGEPAHDAPEPSLKRPDRVG
jgi:hypothetical protein